MSVRKIWVNGELFADDAETGVVEAVALEKATGLTYGVFQRELGEGSVRALAAYVWLLYRRAGKDVPYEDLMSGEVPLNLESLRFDTGVQDEGDGKPVPPTLPAGTPSTGGVTSPSSPRSST